MQQCAYIIKKALIKLSGNSILDVCQCIQQASTTMLKCHN